MLSSLLTSRLNDLLDFNFKYIFFLLRLSSEIIYKLIHLPYLKNIGYSIFRYGIVCGPSGNTQI